MVKPGYKQTEIGILPELWDTITFEDCFAILPNNTLSRAELNYNGGEVRNIHYGDILVKFSAVLDCSAEGLPYINKENSAKTSKGFLRDGDLIMADTAEDVIVGKSTEVIGIGNSKVVSGLHTIPCRPKDTEMFAPKWLGYFINHCTYHDQLIPYITGIKVSSVSKSAISNTVIAVPPKSEQKAIAEALSDIDALIVNLEKLIAKKKAIKQGALQELLTGKRRLPGFTGQWMEYTLGDFVQCIRGVSYDGSADLSQYETAATVRLLRSNNIKNARFVDADVQYVYRSKVKIPQHLCADDIMVCMANGSRSLVGKSCFFENPFVCDYTFGAFMSCLRKKEPDTNMYYIFNLMNSDSYWNQIAILFSGSSINNLRPTDILNMRFSFPLSNEQTAICEVVRDMESEILDLEGKLYKYQGIMLGMMSELLTGRIRLIDKEDA